MKFMFIRTLLVLCLLAAVFSVEAQSSLLRENIPVAVNGSAVKYPWVGGFNCPQFGHVDVDFDGLIDLYVFDRVGNVSTIYRNNGSDYVFAPEFSDNFPAMTDWVLLRDYNSDGIADIFTFSDVAGIAGMRIFRGYNDAGVLKYDRIEFTNNPYNLVYIPVGSIYTNLYIAFDDYPDLVDIDSDGDLDVLTFEPGGGTIDYYKNFSQENGFGNDSLSFKLGTNCWGEFYESGISVELELSNSPDSCAANVMAETSAEIRHVGSTLLAYDADNDGDKELLLGDISFDNINYAHNAGSASHAWMNMQDNVFPANSLAIDIPAFPATFLADVDRDGIKDLIAAPNNGTSAENYEVGWYYRNTGTNNNPIWTYQTKTAFIDDMLDLGSGAHPAFADLDADGDLDMVVGNNSFFVAGGNKNSRLFRFDNVGTATSPSFDMVDDDYLDLNFYSSVTWSFSPTFGDLDGDGDLDLIVGDELGNLFYFKNTAGANQPIQFNLPIPNYKKIDVGLAANPTIVDLDRDGLSDLVIGERNGNLNYYRNVGTLGNPEFNPDNTDPAIATNEVLGGVDTRLPGTLTGHSQPVFVDFNGQYMLFCGTESGTVFQYNNIENNLTSGLFTKLTQDYGQLRQGTRTNIAIADLDNDEALDVIIGNHRGGMSAFRTTYHSDGTGSVTPQPTTVVIAPNPADDVVNITVYNAPNSTANLSIWNVLGQQIINTAYQYQPIETKNLPAGCYYLRLQWGETVVTKTFIKK